MHHFILLLITVLAVISGHGSAFASDDIERQLVQAERYRLSDPEALISALDELSSSVDQMQGDQSDRYQFLLAYRYAFEGQIDQAIAQYRLIAETSEHTDLRYRSYVSISDAYKVQKNYSLALENLNLASDLEAEVSNADLIRTGMLVRSSVFNELGQYQLGLEFANRLIEQPLSGSFRCMAGVQIVEAKLYLGHADVPELADQTYTHCLNEKQILFAAFARTFEAEYHIRQDNHALGLQRLESIEALVRQTRYEKLIAQWDSLMALSHWKLGHLEPASTYAFQALNTHGDNLYWKSAQRSHEVIKNIALTRGQLDTALEHYEQEVAAEKAYTDEFSAKNLAFQMAQHDLREKNSRIELLNKENQVLTLQRSLDREAAENTRLFLILLCVTIAFIALWAYRTKLNQIRFREMAQCDELTGAFNRRHFSELANQHLALAEKEGSSVSLVMFDLDHFKRVNDRFGHLVGDWVLQETINVCRQFCREQDVFGRLGGEEFGIIMPSCSLEHAAEFAEKCRRHLSMIDTRPTEHEFSIEASFGVAESTLDGYRLKQLISAADQALYVAKSRGRNRVVTSQDDQTAASAPV